MEILQLRAAGMILPKEAHFDGEKKLFREKIGDYVSFLGHLEDELRHWVHFEGKLGSSQWKLALLLWNFHPFFFGEKNNTEKEHITFEKSSVFYAWEMD